MKYTTVSSNLTWQKLGVCGEYALMQGQDGRVAWFQVANIREIKTIRGWLK